MVQNKRAFTLIELLVVILIIGILAAVALPQYQVAVGKSRVKRVLPILRSILNAEHIFYLANGTCTNNIEELDVVVEYSSRENEAQEKPWGREITYYGVNDGLIRLYDETWAIVWSGGLDSNKVSINMMGNDNTAACYGHSVLGDKICKSMGVKIKNSSTSGYPTYSIY